MTNSNLVAVFNGIIANQSVQLCNARSLYEFLGVKNNFANWIQDRISEYGFIENEDYIIITERTAGRPRKEYHITLDMGKELGMVEKNEKGRQIRKYFIKVENLQKSSQIAPLADFQQPKVENKNIDNKNEPQYTEALSKNTKRLPHPSDLAVFLCQFNGGSIAGKYNTVKGIPSSRFLCMPESESRHPQTNVANLSKNTKELAMTNIITAHYNGTQVFFQDDAYLNATTIAAHFNKKPIEWLRLPSTEEYINALCQKEEVEKSHFIKTTKGKGKNGTWLHRRLAVAFARWLNVEFAIWCDEQIENILINQNQPQQLTLPEPSYHFDSIAQSDEALALFIKMYSYCLQAHQMQQKLKGTSIPIQMESTIGGQYLFNFEHPLSYTLTEAKAFIQKNAERLPLVRAVHSLLN